MENFEEELKDEEKSGKEKEKKKKDKETKEGLSDKKKSSDSISKKMERKVSENFVGGGGGCASNVMFTNGRYVRAAPPESCIREMEDQLYNTKQELLDYVQCRAPKVQSSNYYVSDQNDANFQSDVMNLNRFYRKGALTSTGNPADYEVASMRRSMPDPHNNHFGSTTYKAGQEQNSGNGIRKGVSYSLQPNTWRYEDEMPMNGGEILPGLTGYDSLADQYSYFDNGAPFNKNCDPPTRGATVNDDLRMGLGVPNSGRRGRT
jgi:hypothetical protein